MSDVKSYPHGTFSWSDLMTTDAAGAKAFYTSLFGWTTVDNPIPGGGVYTMLQQDGKDVTALNEMNAEMKEQGMPPVWNSYITVDNVDATTAKAKELGGTAMMEPFDVMEAGRMSVIQDPTGGIVSLWQAKNHPGAGVFNVPCSMAWNELATRDPEAALAFYTGLLGWEAQTDDASGYTYWSNNGRANGGMIQMTDEWGDIPPHWTVYFSVADINESVGKVKELGGNVMIPPTEAPGVGFFSVVQDPQGASLTIMQLNEPDTTMP